MWSNYDEDLSQNYFFKEIKQYHEDILKKAAEEGWIICIPRRGSLKSEDISIKVILDNVLVQNSETAYTTLSKKDVCLHNNLLKIEQNSIFKRDVEILFEETHYIEQSDKFIVWCINWPLFVHQNTRQYINNNEVSLVTIQDCIDFLYSESLSNNLLEGIQKLCTQFWENQENAFEMESLQTQKDFIGNLYSQCLQLCFKSEIIHNKCEKNPRTLENFKLSVETYMQYCLGKRLMFSVNTLQHFTDCMVNKNVRNSSYVTLSDFNIPEDLCDLIVDARYEISRINNFVTVLDKAHCLSQIFATFNNKHISIDKQVYVTSDDFLQIFVYLILKSNIPNWSANLTYLKEFQFSTFTNSERNEFLVTNLEAALAFITSSQFLDIRQTVNSQTFEKPQLFNQLYKVLKDSRTISDLDELYSLERQKNSQKLCHPLCSCLKCEQIRSQNTDNTPYKILNCFNQNFVIVSVIENNLDFLEFLLTLDYDLDFQDCFGKTALHYASEKGYQGILMLLINANTNVNILDNDRNSALHLACDRGYDNCVKALVYSSPLVEINLQNISRETPLFLATRWGYLDIIKILLENGASVCLKNNRNMSIYQLAPNFYISKLFRQFGCQKSSKILEEVKSDKNNYLPNNVLNISEDCQQKMFNLIQPRGLLFGIQPKASPEFKKIELLLRAIVNNDTPLACFYLGFNSNLPDQCTDNAKKCHPLCTCTQCSNDLTDSILQPKNVTKDCKFNVNMCDKDGFTPLHTAAKYGRTEILRVLLDCGALLNIRTKDTLYTSLHLAVMFQRVQVVRELLNCGGCEVDAQDFKGNTPLYYACIRINNNTNINIVQWLLQNGADCKKKNFEEKTVLQICEEKNMFRICRILRESVGYLPPKAKNYVSSREQNNFNFEDVDSDFEFLL